MNWSFFLTLLVALIVVMTIGYVIKVNRGNGHSTDDDNTPWEK